MKENEVAGTCEVKESYDEVVYCTVGGEELSGTKETMDFEDHNYQGNECNHCVDLYITGSAIVIRDVSANEDDSVDVRVEVKNNPGLFGVTKRH